MNTYQAILLFFVCLFILGVICVRSGNIKKQDKITFDFMYGNLQHILFTWPVNEKNYYLILGYFAEIRGLKYHNNEKYEVLRNKFCKDYKEISNDILREDEEFSVENTLG